MMKKTSVTRLQGGGVQANLVVQLFNLEVYQSSLPNFEGRLYLQSWELYSAATRVGGTTQDKRSPKGHNRVEENPPEKESRGRRYRIQIRTVWQVSDVRRLYVRCQIFQWAGPWCQMTGVWGDRRMSDDFTRNGSGIGPSSWILDRTLDVDAGPGNHCCQCLHKGCFSRWDLNMAGLSEE